MVGAERMTYGGHYIAKNPPFTLVILPTKVLLEKPSLPDRQVLISRSISRDRVTMLSML